MLVREKVQHRLTSGAWITKGSIVLTISTDLKTVSNPVIEKTVSKWYNIGEYLERKIEFRREGTMNKITCICLGVKDMERSIKFYKDGLGYQTDCKENNPPVCFFNTPGTKFELFPLEQLAKDIDEDNPPKGNGFSGITLAYNVEHKEDVNSVIDLVRNIGGTIVKEPQDTFWGGYHAYFSDLDGYYWEVAWGPNFKFDENGLLKF